MLSFSRPNGFMKSYQNKLLERQLQEEILAQFYLPYAKLEFDSHNLQNDWLSVGVTSAQGWRIQQEDAHLSSLDFDPQQQVALFGVFDGHNGPEVSNYASHKLPYIIQNNPHYSKKDYAKSLEESFLEFDHSLLDEKVNQELHDIKYQYEMVHGATRRRQVSPLLAMSTGSTAVVALLTKSGQFHVANIGDSRCVLCIKGKPYALSRDHKPTDEEEQKRIERAGCRVINGRINQGLNLSRAFGDHMLKRNENLGASEQAVSALPEITLTEEKIKAGDFMILACDGIWNCMSNKEICSFVRKHLKKGMKLSKICEEVVRKCVSPVRPIDGQLGGDNMTCIIIKFEQDLI